MSWSAVIHFSLIFIFALLLAGLQTTFWFQIFGPVTAPLLWLVVFTYIAIYRNGISALFQLMFLAVMIAAFTATSLKVFYLALLIYFSGVYLFKSRIFWSGSGYFLMVCTMGAVGFHGIYYVLSALIDKSNGDPMIFERLTQVLLTPAFGFPIYWVMQAVDGVFIKKEIQTDVRGVTYE